LAEYARQFNQHITIIPTVVNTDEQGLTKVGENERIVVGWTGSHSTLMYVEALEDVLLKLKKEFEFDVMIMANKEPHFRELGHHFIPWSEKAEIEELAKIDIGIMPLPDDEWTKGKCGLKAIQYMALGKPAVVSGVGVNSEIVDHGINGFVCYTDEDWEKYLGLLISNRMLCIEMGASAYKKVEDFYSLKKGALAWCDVL
jgi:glycosyltransferase involved in cell wall biosynthesis